MSTINKPSTGDVRLRCATCGESFLFTLDDQVRHALNEWAPPRHCPACRRDRRAERHGGLST